MRHFALALLLLSTRSASAEEIWAGHEVMVGVVRVPLLGAIPTRTENFLVARVEKRGDELHMVQYACAVDMKPVLGSRASIPPSSVRKMPEVPVVFRPAQRWWFAGPWISGWRDRDVEGDGHPGVTVHLEIPLCGGQVYVATKNRSIARGQLEGDRLSGEIHIRTESEVLGTSGGCLDLFAGGGREEVRGTFVYAKVPDGSTCASLEGHWPVKAAEPPAE